MLAAARLALAFALALPGILPAAENLPPLRVDPALLGRPAKPAAPAATKALPVPAPEATPPAQPVAGQATVQPVVEARPEEKPVEKKQEAAASTAVKEEEARPAKPPPSRQAAPAKPEPPLAAAEAKPAAVQERPRPAVGAAEDQPVSTGQPAQAAERPVVTQTFSAQAPAPTNMPVLRVDPGLLGKTTKPAPAGQQPATVAGRPAETVAAQGAQDVPPLRGETAESPVQDAGPVPDLKTAGALLPHEPDKDTPYPTFIAASRIDGSNDNEVVAQGEAELRKTNTNLTADRLTYWKIEDELEAVGNVRYNKDAEYVSGPKLRLNLTDSTGFFEQPEYSVTRAAKQQKEAYSPTLGGSALTGKKFPTFLPQDKTRKPAMSVIAGEAVVEGGRLTTASGKADRLEFQGENRMRLINATYTTCTADDPDWYAKVGDLNLDYDREVGEGRDATVVFKDVPLLYTPWISFSLNNKRKSGFLAPTFGTSSKSGVEFSLPYYWDIAPNMDMTITPRLMTKRGLQINSEYRYLNHNYRGIAHVEWLPNDRLADRNRYGFSLVHSHHNLGHGFSGMLNVNGVSDGTYFRDLSSRITQASQGNLLRQGVLTYGGGGWWSAMANMQVYQTLQDPALPPVVKPYERVPQLTLTASRPEFVGGTAFAFNGEFVVFDHPTLDTARRTTFYPQLSLPLQAAFWNVTPKIGFHSTRYDIDRRSSTGPGTVVRNLPIFSVDAGVAFERDFSWFGKGLTQTLEPRLYYLAIPQRTQDDIPIFDSGLADFNFATIFSDNIYSGVDRIADANQLTAALTSRLIDPGTGEEYVRGLVGQRYYFAKQHVTLPGESARPAGTSDFLAALSGRLMPKTYGDLAWQYDPRDGETERFTVGARWQPEVARVLNASYRYTRDHTGITGGTAGIRQVDFSGQWPLARGWYGVGRFNYSLRESKIIEAVAGLEYNGGCWVGRTVLQRYATASGDTNTALFVQLELNDFSSIGSNPLQMLARRIPGYGRINQVAPDPVFGYE